METVSVMTTEPDSVPYAVMASASAEAQVGTTAVATVAALLSAMYPANALNNNIVYI